MSAGFRASVFAVLAVVCALAAGFAQQDPVDTIYVFTDRNVYRPGMVVVVNVLVRDAEGVPLRDVEFYVSMIDSADQVVFERLGKTWANGSFVTYAVLPGDAFEGYYRIDVVALVDIVPTPSSTIYILVCRLCHQYNEATQNPPSVVTVTETEYVPVTRTVSVVRTVSAGVSTTTATVFDTVTTRLVRSVTLTATLEVNPYSYVPGLAVLAFAGYTATLFIVRRYQVKKS
ncbi:MAG: MG2 domain-containing protein [Candidatus Caldarchaeum sp.]|nr:MG2 domain-containing protein [Candidatus Caldarchaeum sp.]MCS7137640.1 MG2 domain-containing protein [Candidatus Caldarchaeum sp.]MDW7978749.1 MG2 domain-containing protein [Candidatus Caldarchaeum sp.]MDW8359142.1 MG2 domain-containing protein [Candidatus Caldarchaeum sp.]